MNLETTNNLNEKNAHFASMVQTLEGIYHSRTINKDPSYVYSFCQEKENIQKILEDLPETITNFLELEFVTANSQEADIYQVEWKNSDSSKIQGELIFRIQPDAHKGSLVIANALFADYRMENEGPSDLINIFLKRVKALAETGQIATTKGQPNGKDEKEMDKILKH